MQTFGGKLAHFQYFPWNIYTEIIIKENIYLQRINEQKQCFEKLEALQVEDLTREYFFMGSVIHKERKIEKRAREEKFLREQRDNGDEQSYTYSQATGMIIVAVKKN